MTKNLRSRTLLIVLIAVIFIGVFSPIKVQATDSVNDEPVEEPTYPIVYIKSEQELASIDTSVYNHFVLTEDIEISGNWNPISNFTGTFDGSGHTITFNISETTGPIPSTPYLGLFASCTDATIKNLYVNGKISLTTGGSFFNPNVYVGGIVANSTNSTLENVHFSGNITITTSNDNSSWVGGLVGQATNTQISLSSNTAQIISEVKSIIGTTRTGGLCGEFSGKIENCYNLGNILGKAATESPYAGGLVGKNKGTITKSYNSGKVNSEGSGLSLSDVYAGGITAIGETGSSVTDCAVMSPEISVTIGWVNTGYKYIIANGGNKSNNISINNITGSPTNDSNSQYTQTEMKTTAPYKNFDFYNTWAIDGNINNGYPYHDRNIYAINIQYENVPNGLKTFIDNNYISINDIKQTSDGFTLCTKPLNEVFSSMGISEVRSDQKNDKNEQKIFSLEDLDDWYIFSVGNSYSILKMRNGIGEEKGSENPGTAIPFMELDLELIHLFHEDIIQQFEELENELPLLEHELQLYHAIDNVTRGVVDSDFTYSIPIANYFASLSSEGNHLIAEEYIRKIISNDMDSNGYIIVPNEIDSEQKKFLLTLHNIYDEENERIRVNKYNLTNAEKHAILVCHTGNQSINNYAAENYLHAKYTILFGNFLQGTDELLELDGEVVDRVAGFTKFSASIKADAGVGEESFKKEMIPISTYANIFKIKFGDV